MRTEDLDYELPEHLIAQRPADRRETARLMAARLHSDAVEHRTVSDLPDLLRPGDLLVLNDTRVLPARFYGRRAETGGRVEGLFLQMHDDCTWQVMIKAGGKLQPGERIRLTETDALHLREQQPDGSWLAEKLSDLETHALLDRVGSMPLPPYIQRRRDDAADGATETLEAEDRRRYQTVFARQPGAVAAPTAGLHFTETLLETLREAGIEIAWLTLHVGPGTFAPVRAERLEQHAMHGERFTVPRATLRALQEARRADRRIIPVGTTCVRALESLPASPEADSDYTAETRLLIQPGFEFRYTDGLMTNFHLPRSTLLALVAALTGLERIKRLYETAVEHEYRFYSYGDAMLLLPE